VSRRKVLLTVTLSLTLLSLSSLISSCSPIAGENRIASWSGGLIIDHNCVDLSLIPGEWIESAQDDIRIHYAHTSHGGQITEGLSRLEVANSTFDVSIGYLVLPTDAASLCILDGNPPESYITPDLYWQGVSALELTQDTIDDNPTLTVSLWSWCTQVDYYSEQEIQDYLEAMTSLEVANPDITFVYMTGNAQSGGSSGYNRWIRNDQIRQYCLDNDKILFDFADLDSWSNGDHSTYDYIVGDETLSIPIEHTDFNGDEAGHTTYSSCEQKGRAFWWLMAKLSGWNVPDPTTTPSSTTSSSTSSNTSINGPIVLNDVLLPITIAGIVLVAGCALFRRRNP